MASYFYNNISKSDVATNNICEYRKQRGSFVDKFIDYIKNYTDDLIVDSSKNYGKNNCIVDVEALKSCEAVKEILVSITPRWTEPIKFCLTREEKNRIFDDLMAYYSSEGFTCKLTGLSTIKITWLTPEEREEKIKITEMDSLDK